MFSSELTEPSKMDIGHDEQFFNYYRFRTVNCRPITRLVLKRTILLNVWGTIQAIKIENWRIEKLSGLKIALKKIKGWVFQMMQEHFNCNF